MKVTVRGASDDLIEIDGDIQEEFSALREFDEDRDGAYLAFSDGTVLRIVYGDGDASFWRVRREIAGTATYTLVEATDVNTDYSDKATLEGDNLTWVAIGKQVQRAKKKVAR